MKKSCDSTDWKEIISLKKFHVENKKYKHINKCGIVKLFYLTLAFKLGFKFLNIQNE